MEYLHSLPWYKIIAVTTGLCIFSFFALLIVANVTNRRGITELNDIRRESYTYEERLANMEIESATYSSLVRVEQRAKELGFEKAKKVEYLK
jgi:cell division protein FtsL